MELHATCVPWMKRVTRWTTSVSVFLIKGYTDWPFLWQWLVSMGRAGPRHRKTSSVSWCAWACCLLTTQLSIRLEQLVLLLSVLFPHRSVMRRVICSCPFCPLAVLFQHFWVHWSDQNYEHSCSAVGFVCLFFLVSIWLSLLSKGFTPRKIAFEALVLQKQLLFCLWGSGGRK